MFSEEAQERLEYAIQHYKKGTKFTNRGYTSVVEGKKPYMNAGEEYIIWNGSGKGRIYSHGEWAKIIKTSINEKNI